MYLLLTLLFLFPVRYDCQELFLTIRPEENGQELSNNSNISSKIVNADLYQTTTYTNGSASGSRCICQAVQGENSLLEYSSNIDSCISDPYSPSALGVCSLLVFSNDTYRIEVENAKNPSSLTMNVTQFCAKMELVRESLAKFETLLAQTLVCVYLKSCDEKNLCLVR